MLTFESHPQEIQQMKDIINRNVFFGMLFIKSDNSLRPVNGRKVKYESTSTDAEKRGKWDRGAHNIMTIFDRNKQYMSHGQPVFKADGKPLMNAPISVKLDRLLFFKAGSLLYDFSQINAEAIQRAGLSMEQVDAEKQRIVNNYNSLEKETPLEVVRLEDLTTDPQGQQQSPEDVVQEMIREFLNNLNI